jgi:hypothetical protein
MGFAYTKCLEGLALKTPESGLSGVRSFFLKKMVIFYDALLQAAIPFP